eukprot:TRINITY_DN7583_c0_g1_i2.p1 TRINITY_DN7583_c0_g1~~TRINITY_DN7583_c0_g1_i2.p1  ORF type:complete len:466 (+),score=102.82 TRINITY_DN7583_c0_g1_i2:192-1589(+)
MVARKMALLLGVDEVRGVLNDLQSALAELRCRRQRRRGRRISQLGAIDSSAQVAPSCGVHLAPCDRGGVESACKSPRDVTCGAASRATILASASPSRQRQRGSTCAAAAAGAAAAVVGVAAGVCSWPRASSTAATNKTTPATVAPTLDEAVESRSVTEDDRDSDVNQKAQQQKFEEAADLSREPSRPWALQFEETAFETDVQDGDDEAGAFALSSRMSPCSPKAERRRRGARGSNRGGSQENGEGDCGAPVHSFLRRSSEADDETSATDLSPTLTSLSFGDFSTQDDFEGLWARIRPQPFVDADADNAYSSGDETDPDMPELIPADDESTAFEEWKLRRAAALADTRRKASRRQMPAVASPTSPLLDLTPPPSPPRGSPNGACSLINASELLAASKELQLACDCMDDDEDESPMSNEFEGARDFNQRWGSGDLKQALRGLTCEASDEADTEGSVDPSSEAVESFA